jgi:hypothetical protein
MITRLWLALLWRIETFRVRHTYAESVAASRRLSRLRDAAAQANATQAEVEAYSRALRAYWRSKHGVPL